MRSGCVRGTVLLMALLVGGMCGMRAVERGTARCGYVGMRSAVGQALLAGASTVGDPMDGERPTGSDADGSQVGTPCWMSCSGEGVRDGGWK